RTPAQPEWPLPRRCGGCTVILHPLQAEDAGVAGAGVEPDELVVGGAADPVEHAAVLLAQVGGAVEEDGAAGPSSVHLDRVLVRPPALALEGRVPHAAPGLDDAVERLALLLVQCGGVGWVVRPPFAGP